MASVVDPRVAMRWLLSQFAENLSNLVSGEKDEQV